MNFLAWLLGLSLLLVLSLGAVDFFKASVCRQKAWLKGSELQTRTLLHNPPASDQAVDISCKLYVIRKNKTITWQRLPNLKKHLFNLPLKGKL